MDVEICYGISKDSTFSQSGGPMMRIPISTDDPAAIKTAAAPTSLPILASSCCSGLARSTTASRAVLRNSAAHTSATDRIITAQSRGRRRSHNPRRITMILARACIQALCCERTTYHQPVKANRKD